MTAALISRRPAHLLRQEPYPAWRQPGGRRGQDHRAARPQRRRQDHDAAQPDGPDPAREGKITIFGQDTTHWPTFRIAAAGRRLCARRPAHLRQSQRRGKSQGPARTWRPMDHRANLPALSPPRGTQAQSRPPALRRRTGDAVDRPCAAAQPAPADSRRAFARLGAADRARGVSHRRSR